MNNQPHHQALAHLLVAAMLLGLLGALTALGTIPDAALTGVAGAVTYHFFGRNGRAGA